MIALAAALLIVPVLDQALKLVVLHGLAPASVFLGPLGKLKVVRSRIWLARPGFISSQAITWSLWMFTAASLAVLSSFFPSFGLSAGLLLGGSLSHALETTLRGCIIDYVCLRFWPAFNLADVAITVGALGILVLLVTLNREAW